MGIVSGVPVRPVRLGYALSVYAAKMKANYLPLQRFLKYAENPGNEFSRLPPEVLKMVFDLVLYSESGSSQGRVVWMSRIYGSKATCARSWHARNASM